MAAHCQAGTEIGAQSAAPDGQRVTVTVISSTVSGGGG
jgi:hypothetical protein